MSTLVKRQMIDSANRAQTPAEFGSLRFDWAMLGLCMIFVSGLFLDGWAHNHGYVDDSFFTPWHAFFYSGFLLIVLLLGGTMLANRAIVDALPAGYQLSLLGVLIFAAGGVGDMIWHELFGVEADFEALFSPSHLTLAAGMALIVSGPLRAAWARIDEPNGQPGWRQLAPALGSLTALLSILTFLAMGSHPLAATIAGAQHPRYAGQIGQIAGVSSMLLTTGLLLGPVLLLMRRWTLPPGSLILIWGTNTVAMAIVNWHHDHTIYLLGAMLLAIVVLDVVYQRLVTGRRIEDVRWFAALAPFAIFAAYFAALMATEGIAWSIHLWTGAIVEVGLAGWLLSYLVAPPAIPEHNDASR